MLRNNKGITLFALIMTIVLLTILTGVSLNTGFDVIKDVRVGRIISNMTLIKAKVETIQEEYTFYNNGTDCLVGQGPYKMSAIENVSMSEEEVRLIAQQNNVTETEVSNWDWYKWDGSILESQGLDKKIVGDDEAFYVHYGSSEIVYSKGTSYNNTTYFYSMTGLNELLKEH